MGALFNNADDIPLPQGQGNVVGVADDRKSGRYDVVMSSLLLVSLDVLDRVLVLELVYVSR